MSGIKWLETTFAQWKGTDVASYYEPKGEIFVATDGGKGKGVDAAKSGGVGFAGCSAGGTAKPFEQAWGYLHFTAEDREAFMVDTDVSSTLVEWWAVYVCISALVHAGMRNVRVVIITDSLPMVMQTRAEVPNERCWLTMLKVATSVADAQLDLRFKWQSRETEEIKGVDGLGRGDPSVIHDFENRARKYSLPRSFASPACVFSKGM